MVLACTFSQSDYHVCLSVQFLEQLLHTWSSNCQLRQYHSCTHACAGFRLYSTTWAPSSIQLVTYDHCVWAVLGSVCSTHLVWFYIVLPLQQSLLPRNCQLSFELRCTWQRCLLTSATGHNSPSRQRADWFHLHVCFGQAGL